MSKNSIGNALIYVGVIFIVFSILGGLYIGNAYPIVAGLYYTTTTYNWALALSSAFVGSVSGLITVGIGEIIILLQSNFEILKSFKSDSKHINLDDEKLPEL